MSRHVRIAGMYTPFWPAVICLLAVIVTSASGADKVTLALHLKTGQILKLATTTESNVTQTILGQEMNAGSKTGMVYTFEVQQVGDDGIATCKVTYSAVQLTMSMPGMSIDFDSAKPSATPSPMVKPFAALVGQSFTLRVSQAGQVTEVKGHEAIYEKIVKDLPVPDESMRQAMEDLLKDQFSDESIRETLEEAIGSSFPPGPVDINESWTTRKTVTRPYPMSLESTYILKDRKAGVAVIDVVSKIGPNAAGKPMQFGPVTTTTNILSGERKGQVEIDEASGWTVGARYSQQISGTINVEGLPQGTTSFPISATATMRIESKK